MFALNAHQGSHLPQDTWDSRESGFTLPTFSPAGLISAGWLYPEVPSHFLLQVLRGQANQEDRIPWRPQKSTKEKICLWVSIVQFLPTLPPTALIRVIMSFEQKSQHCKPDEGLEALEGALGLVGVQAPTTEEQEAAASSSTLIPGTLEEVLAAGSTGPPQSPQGASAFLTTVNFTRWRQLNEGSSSSNQGEEGPSTSPDPESAFHAALSKKVEELVCFLLLKYRAKEPVTEAEMLEKVIKKYKHYFPVIFGKASESLKMIFGIDVKELDPTDHSYVLVTCLGLSYDGLGGGNPFLPKTGLLILVLSTIAMEGICASEEEIWEELSVMGLYDGREHSVFGEPRKLLTQDWVQENYLEYRQVPGSDPARYEFLWGPRALAETSYLSILEHIFEVNGRVRIRYPSLRDAALREEEEGV
ncbi:Melanoma-associated antigen 4 [Plecturocebus cupreus]